jgi:hypothetical protein
MKTPTLNLKSQSQKAERTSRASSRLQLSTYHLPLTIVPCPSFRRFYTFFTYSAAKLHPSTQAFPRPPFAERTTPLEKPASGGHGVPLPRLPRLPHSTFPSQLLPFTIFTPKIISCANQKRFSSRAEIIDRSLIDPDRPQTIDHQGQSTSDRFLKSRFPARGQTHSVYTTIREANVSYGETLSWRTWEAIKTHSIHVTRLTRLPLCAANVHICAPTKNAFSAATLSQPGTYNKNAQNPPISIVQLTLRTPPTASASTPSCVLCAAFSVPSV